MFGPLIVAWSVNLTAAFMISKTVCRSKFSEMSLCRSEHPGQILPSAVPHRYRFIQPLLQIDATLAQYNTIYNILKSKLLTLAGRLYPEPIQTTSWSTMLLWTGFPYCRTAMKMISFKCFCSFSRCCISEIFVPYAHVCSLTSSGSDALFICSRGWTGTLRACRAPELWNNLQPSDDF